MDCSSCRFWDARPKPDDTDPLAEDWQGNCRRHAPRAPIWVAHRGVEELTQIAWALYALAGIKEPPEYGTAGVGEDHADWATWPLTHAEEWCGEWMAKALIAKAP